MLGSPLLRRRQKVQGIARRLDAWNRRERRPIAPRTRAQLAERYQADLNHFFALTGLNICEEEKRSSERDRRDAPN
jgi:hypothetical protein